VEKAAKKDVERMVFVNDKIVSHSIDVSNHSIQGIRHINITCNENLISIKVNRSVKIYVGGQMK